MPVLGRNRAIKQLSHRYFGSPGVAIAIQVNGAVVIIILNRRVSSGATGSNRISSGAMDRSIVDIFIGISGVRVSPMEEGLGFCFSSCSTNNGTIINGSICRRH
jgi:hypothetical protein